MKQKDFALIAVIAIVSGVISFVISGKLFVTTANRQQTVVVIDRVTTDFNQPNTKYFNSTSVDPSQTIQIGNGNNQTPFNGASQ